MNKNLAMLWQWSGDHVGSLRRLELDLFGIDHVLNFVLQCPTVLSIVPRAIRMISTPRFWVVAWRGGLGIGRRVNHRNQVHFQHVLQCLGPWHVDVGELSFRLVRPSLISLL